MHRRDPRAKIIVLLMFLVVVATTPPPTLAPYLLLGYALLPIGAILAGRLPVAGVLARASVVLPFCAIFAATSALAGDLERAAALLEKSYLSALAVLAVAGTTPVARFLRGMEALGAPRFLLWVVHFLHRYLFVISEQAQHMRLAAASRGSASGARFRRWRVKAASGALAVLFAKSYGRAEATYRAMLSRGFQGRLQLLDQMSLNWGDGFLMVLGVTAPLALRVTLGTLQ